MHKHAHTLTSSETHTSWSVKLLFFLPIKTQNRIWFYISLMFSPWTSVKRSLRDLRSTLSRCRGSWVVVRDDPSYYAVYWRHWRSSSAGTSAPILLVWLACSQTFQAPLLPVLLHLSNKQTKKPGCPPWVLTGVMYGAGWGVWGSAAFCLAYESVSHRVFEVCVNQVC